MRFMPTLAITVTALGLAACSINTAPRTPDVAVVQQPAPAMMTTTQPATTVVVPR